MLLQTSSTLTWIDRRAAWWCPDSSDGSLRFISQSGSFQHLLLFAYNFLLTFAAGACAQFSRIQTESGAGKPDSKDTFHYMD